LLNNHKITNNDIIKLKHNDMITIPNKNIKLILKIKERERSRDKETRVEDKEEAKVKTEDPTPKHIASEVIWNNVSFSNDKKKDKFLKLLGAKKGDNTSALKDDKLSKEIGENFKKINDDLEKQFNNTHNRRK
jgi:hypothetical protein